MSQMQAGIVKNKYREAQGAGGQKLWKRHMQKTKNFSEATPAPAYGISQSGCGAMRQIQQIRCGDSQAHWAWSTREGGIHRN